MKREHLMVAGAGALVLVAIVVVLARGPSEPGSGSPQAAPTSGQGKPSRDPAPPRRVVREAGIAVTPKEFEKELGEAGFAVSGTRDSRAGLLRISAPGDLILGGDSIVAAPGGDGFQLRGNVSMRSGKTVYRSRDDGSYLRIASDGTIEFGPGDWKAEVLEK